MHSVCVCMWYGVDVNSYVCACSVGLMCIVCMHLCGAKLTLIVCVHVYIWCGVEMQVCV